MPKVQPKATTKASRVRSAPYSAKDSKRAPAKGHCSVCNKYFPRQGDLNRHERTHSDDIEVRLPHKCTLCHHRVANKDALRPHMQSKHSSSPQYKCSICGKGQNTKSGLSHHERSHNKPKPVPQPKETFAARMPRRQRKHKGYTDTVSEIPDSSEGSSSLLTSPELLAPDNQPSYYCFSVESVSDPLFYDMPSSFDPVVETSFTSHISPSDCTLGAIHSRNELVDVFSASSHPAFDLSSTLYENDYNFNLSMDSSQLEDLCLDFPTAAMVQSQTPVDAYSLDFSTGFVHDLTPTVADAFFDDDLTQFPFNFTPFLQEVAAPSQAMQSDLELELESYTYSFGDQTYFSAAQELQSVTIPSGVAAPHQPDASWEAWLAQGGDPSLVAYFNSSFPFNDDVPSLVYSCDTFAEQRFIMDYPIML